MQLLILFTEQYHWMKKYMNTLESESQHLSLEVCVLFQIQSEHGAKKSGNDETDTRVSEHTSPIHC